MRLIRDLSISVNNGDRIGVIGKNGKGKTTLLKLLAGALKPESGGIQNSPNLEIGFFEQTNTRLLDDTRTVEEEVLYSCPDIDRQKARDICGAMMFEGDSALKKIAVLSGGERSRVLLGKILATPVNLLILDEPTNHLDMDSCDALLAALDSFEGTVIMVTHNEMFLHALADRLIVFQDDHVSVFEGGYQYFLEKEGWHDENIDRPVSREVDEKMTLSGRLTKKELRQRRSEIIIEKGKKLKPLDRKISDVERDIEHYEEKISELNDTMMDASQSNDGKIIAEISKKMHTYQSLIEERFSEFERLYKDRETIESEYKSSLKDF
jgi:ATP-binding cassette subfamily F protein 3